MTDRPSPKKGVWLLASRLLDRDVQFGDEYPHICGITFPAELTETKIGDLVYKRRGRDCAACEESKTGRISLHGRQQRPSRDVQDDVRRR